MSTYIQWSLYGKNSDGQPLRQAAVDELCAMLDEEVTEWHTRASEDECIAQFLTTYNNVYSSRNHIQIWFRYQGYETRSELQKTCAPGYAEQNCDFTIGNAMMSIALKKGDAQMAEFWRNRLSSHSTDRQAKILPAICNQSPHQHFVGQSFMRNGCRMFCLAAHEDSILILQYGESDQPINYVICHRPKIECDILVWDAGDYYTIKNYEYAGRSNPMAAALAAAMNRLLDSSLLEFRFDPIEDEPDNQSVYVLVHGKLDTNELAEIEDSISSYLESMSKYGFEKIVEDVMNAHRTVSYRIIRPDHTFHI